MRNKTNELIKHRRLELGLSLEDVARALGVNRSTVLRYESKDIEKMPIDIIPPLARILQCSPEYLMGWVENGPCEKTIEIPIGSHIEDYDLPKKFGEMMRGNNREKYEATKALMEVDEPGKLKTITKFIKVISEDEEQ